MNYKIVIAIIIIHSCSIVKAQSVENVSGYFLYYQTLERISTDHIKSTEFLVYLDSTEDANLSNNIIGLFLTQRDSFNNFILNEQKIYFDFLSLVNFNYLNPNPSNTDIINIIQNENNFINYFKVNCNYFSVIEGEPSYQINVGVLKMNLILATHTPNPEVNGAFKLEISEENILYFNSKQKESIIYIPINGL